METGRKWRFCFRSTNDRGVSAVEFALVLPVFFVIFFGVIEYGGLLIRQIVLSHAVAEGARAAVRMPDGASDAELAVAAKAAAIDAFSLVGTLADSDINVDIRENAPLPRRILVEVPSWTYTPIVGYLPSAAVPESLSASVIFVFP